MTSPPPRLKYLKLNGGGEKAHMQEEEIFNANSLPARDRVTEWVSIKKNIGDKVFGKFLGYWENPEHDGFKAQLSLAIEQVDGKVVGISVTDTKYMRDNCMQAKIGDSIGLRYEGEKDTGQIQKAKIIKFYNPDAQKRKESNAQVSPLMPESAPQGAETASVDSDDIPF